MSNFYPRSTLWVDLAPWVFEGQQLLQNKADFQGEQLLQNKGLIAGGNFYKNFEKIEENLPFFSKFSSDFSNFYKIRVVPGTKSNFY